MADERQLSAVEWRAYFDDLRERAKDPAAALSLEDFRVLAHRGYSSTSPRPGRQPGGT